MFLPKEKKTSGSKVLTEAEIKKKLYGEYETTSDGLSSASHEVKMSGSVFATQAAKKIDPAPSRSFASSLPANSSVKPAYETSTKPVFSPSRTASAVTPSKAKSAWLQTLSRGGRAFLGFLAGVLWKLGAYFVKFLGFVLKILDPRKPQARRVLYSITACVLVAALFIGVFRLNAQRKKAMLGELPPPAVQTVAAPTALADLERTVDLTDDPTDAASDAVQKEESQEMILKALENSSTVSTSQAPPAVSGGKYVIQVATYALLEDANRVIQSLKQAGFESFYKKQVRNSNGQSFYTVCLGRFESYAAAQENLAKFRKAAAARPFKDAFIRTME